MPYWSYEKFSNNPKSNFRQPRIIVNDHWPQSNIVSSALLHLFENGIKFFNKLFWYAWTFLSYVITFSQNLPINNGQHRCLSHIFITYQGLAYYTLSLEERFYHPGHEQLKPSSPFGHDLGILGTLLVPIDICEYIAKKRYGFFLQFGRLKYWLEFHIFPCTLGLILIRFHTAFKFGGVASASFWSMVAVVLRGIVRRYVYIQIPRTIEGDN